jgi:hypothetical protein
MENEIPVYLSTIVAAEFCVRQEIEPAVLRSCVVLPFNWDDALRAAKFFDVIGARPAEVSRVALKDDLKIIAQASVVEAEFVITDDTGTFYHYCQLLKDRGEVQFKAVKLEDGFVSAFFDAHGQDSIMDALDGPGDSES